MTGQHINKSTRMKGLEDKDKVFLSYLNHLRRRNFSPRTLETYADCLIAFNRWLTTESDIRNPCSIQPKHLEAFQVYLANNNSNHRSVSLGRRGVYVAVLRSFYQFCFKSSLTLNDPSANLQYPKTPKRLHRDILTAKEVKKLLHQLTHDFCHGISLRLLVLSGLRASELVNLDLNDLDLPNREIIIRNGKGNKDRLVFIDITTQRFIARYLVYTRPQLAKSNQKALIVNSQGNRLKVFQLRAMVKQSAKTARITKPITCHSLRRTFATLMLQSNVSGMNLKIIAELMGHARLKTTAKYTKMDIKTLSNVYNQSHPRATSGGGGGT